MSALVVEPHSGNRRGQQFACHRVDRVALPCSRKALPRVLDPRSAIGIGWPAAGAAAQTRMLMLSCAMRHRHATADRLTDPRSPSLTSML
ncbi:hypothetical protein JQ559_04175 [Bradyrhizobium viridifuturi]|uniref:hypothetical protein n=1 Tax=Bradyrhizobium sp. TaxID=376 RepID=UPI0011B28D6E|nr:hypothetical protein [uncultured Bradyrhizobium sp.]MBR1042834.1 hypothetical protein [Bradyrhizobium viridifuturi]QRI67244.1 hypothetical protein JQ507_19825 [Bradyrhizobium sp. PSBB068]